jgi:hypothetical protein
MKQPEERQTILNKEKEQDGSPPGLECGAGEEVK